jgi:hypothetical protein
MHVSFGRFAAPLLALAALSGAASAAASVRAALESVGVEKNCSAILSAELQGPVFVAGLGRCVGA